MARPAKEVGGAARAQAFIDAGAAVIGTPDDAIAAIERHMAETGGFGVAMLMAHDWANSRATHDSYELFARFVMPHFQRLSVNREVSIEELIEARRQAKAGQHGFDTATGAA